ncbi:isoprenyl transferase [Lactobacillus gasseri]|jgi:undecaprenyl diphosphate synthase|uniref:Isoprenyl transferase n=1 Tax=Lactobacillus gasseri SV-16A-US TaxID=575604 RepID=A0AB34P0V4_LACGS|nr:isoprenyl transferase [Lactobacillus gasseri]KFL97403.1 di-trans,poly-cis-decaprenylcistransferase [Lactobacillus gasseri SV-16A-US]MCZ3947334.1 isoprenyl transferase [Lactobacillus gasseri]QTH66116.1 isoprenyl transferase [Lactobacillus gasseri]RGL17433.1 isoprenyl transferase [Lactobacillus gasseri]UNL44407.1 isoprenyl transferase [Lactobacillus gasseri]
MSESKKSLNHLAIIMDGNGRWAKKRHLPRFVGHRHGMDNIRNIALAANEMGIKVLTLYAFSTENWARPTDEVNYLMRLPIDFFDKFMPELMENNVRVNIMGFLDELPEKTYLVTQKAMAETANNTGMVLNFAFNYGSRREITAGVQEIARQVKAGKINPSDIDEKMVSDHLLTHSLTPYDDPDLLIRTSGEERLSNFLLWQMAYTEFSFSNKLWPDFDKNDLENLVKDYYGRNRRFGKL